MFPLLGVAAGVMAGLLGIGGGLVLIGALVWLLPAHGIPADAVMHTALASSLASIILTGASSARAHNARGSVLWPTVAWMVPGLLLGGWLGSWFAVAVRGEVLRWCVALYCFVVAAQMAFGGPRGGAAQDAVVPTGWPMAAAGGGIGAVSAVVGIGGGSMTVPLLVWRGVQPVRAVGTSSGCGVFIAIASAAGYAVHARERALPACAGRRGPRACGGGGLCGGCAAGRPARACGGLRVPAGGDRDRAGLGAGRAAGHAPGARHQRHGAQARVRAVHGAGGDQHPGPLRARR